MAMTSNDDEIYQIVEHFRFQQPAFVSYSAKNHFAAPASKIRKRNGSAATFNSIFYKDNTLRLVYLLSSHGIRLQFNVSTNKKPYIISYVRDKFTSTHDPRLQKQLDQLCKEMSVGDDKNSTSIFSTVSRLLVELQKLKPPPRLSSSSRSQYHLRLLSQRRTAWDMTIVLMRCAAASGKSSKLCTPFPHVSIDHDRSPKFVLSYLRDNIISYLQDTKRNVHPTMDEQAVMEFLACMQWTEHVQISVNDESDDTKKNTPSNHTTVTSKATKVTINLNRDTTPLFNDLADERGSLKAFHGTSVGSAWSILNFGLQQHPSIQKNGAIMGPGVYLSTKFDVAYFFATQNGSAKRLPPEIWRSSPCFWRLVASASKTTTNNLRKMAQDNSLDLMCYVVVECTIIQPSTADGNQNSDKTKGSNKRGASKHEGTYYVVPNLHEIHMEKMHLTFEFIKRPRFFGPWTVALMMVVVATFLWNLRG